MSFRFRIYLWQQSGRLWGNGKKRWLCVGTQVHDRKLQADLCDVYTRCVKPCLCLWCQSRCRYCRTPVSGRSLVRGHLSKFRKIRQYKAVNNPAMGDKRVETLGSKIRFSWVLETLSPFSPKQSWFFFLLDSTDHCGYTTWIREEEEGEGGWVSEN